MGYWENRQAELMVGYMQTADEAAAEIIHAYEEAAEYIAGEMQKIFQRFATQYGLSEAAALRILRNVTDLRSLDALRLAVEVSGEDANELLAMMNSRAYGARIQRWDDLQASLDEVMQRVYGVELYTSTAAYRTIAQEAFTNTIEGVEEQVGFRFAYSHISPAQIDSVLRMPFLGSNYSDRIWANTQSLAQSIRQEMLLGVLTGKSQSQMSQEIADRFSVGASNARRLVRTESAFVANDMQARAYEECGADKYRYVATLDNRTSKVCQSLDGQVFAVRDRQVGVNYPPMHPYCRSTTAIVIDEQVEEGLERRRIARNPVTGRNEYVEGNITYPEWAERYNPPPQAPNADNEVSKACEVNGVERRDVRPYDVTPDVETIINRIGGEDNTGGSCASLSLAYAGNRAGYDVEDYRGGASRRVFAKQRAFRDIAEFPGVDAHVVTNYNDFRAVNELLEFVEPGREYILCTGGHAAIIRGAESGAQYLELQTANNNGFYDLTRSVLQRRFSCKKSHTIYGQRVEHHNVLIDIESLFDSPEFLDILSYINTAGV